MVRQFDGKGKVGRIDSDRHPQHPPDPPDRPDPPGSRLLLVPAGLEAVDTCLRIAGEVAGAEAVTGLCGQEDAGVDRPSRRSFGKMAELICGPSVGGVILVYGGGDEIDAVGLANAIRLTAIPVEAFDADRLGGQAEAEKYGIGLAQGMLLLIDHSRRAALRRIAEKKR